MLPRSRLPKIKLHHEHTCTDVLHVGTSDLAAEERAHKSPAAQGTGVSRSVLPLTLLPGYSFEYPAFSCNFSYAFLILLHNVSIS